MGAYIISGWFGRFGIKGSLHVDVVCLEGVFVDEKLDFFLNFYCKLFASIFLKQSWLYVIEGHLTPKNLSNFERKKQQKENYVGKPVRAAKCLFLWSRNYNIAK